MNRRVPQFELKSKTWVESLSGHLYEFQHACGALHLHLECLDDNLTLGILIPTAPKDSKGTPHVVEHLVMDGSERFPVRNLFRVMRKRSLATYLDGFIRSDSTGYVASSRNKRDFMNLAAVMLDAVFFPLLEEESFWREAWHLEFEDQDEDRPKRLTYQGVLLSELRGQESSTANHVMRALRKALFPGRPESNDPEGNPRDLTSLTLEEVRSFHANHYRPGRAAFFSYGKMPYEEIQERILSDVLLRYVPTAATSSNRRAQLPPPTRDTYISSYPSGAGDSLSKGHSVLAWLIDASDEPFDLFGLDILAEILLGARGDPIATELLSTTVGDDLSDHSGFMMLHSHGVFSVGLKEVEIESADVVPDSVRAGWSTLLKSGIDRHDLERALHQLEVEERHHSNTPVPYSVQVFMNLTSGLLHSSNPLLFVDFDRNIAKLRHLIEEDGYIERLIETYLVENPHVVHILLRPDPSLAPRRQEAETQRLNRLSERLSERERQSILSQQVRFRSFPQDSSNLSKLPPITTSHLPAREPEPEYSSDTVGDNHFGGFSQQTNGLTFIDLQTSFSPLETELMQDLGLFAYAHPRMGTSSLRPPERTDWMRSNVGGLHLIPSVWRHADPSMPLVRSLRIAIRLLSAKNSSLNTLLDMTLRETTFEPNQVREVARELYAEKKSYLVQAGMLYAVLLASSQIGTLGMLKEQLNGVSQLKRLQRQVNYGNDEFERLARQMHAIQEELFSRSGWNACIISERNHLDLLRDQVLEAVSGLKDSDELSPLKEVSGQGENRTTLQGVSIEGHVAYNAKVFMGPDFTHEDAPKVKVLCKVLSQFFDENLKSAGGAYGAEANFDPQTGLVALWTYRDPRVAETFRYFHEVGTDIERNLTRDKLDSAVLGAYADTDPAVSSETRARSRFFDDVSGYTPDRQSDFRRRLVGVQPDDVVDVYGKYLRVQHFGGAVIGPLPKIERFASDSDKPIHITELLSP